MSMRRDGLMISGMSGIVNNANDQILSAAAAAAAAASSTAQASSHHYAPNINNQNSLDNSHVKVHINNRPTVQPDRPIGYGAFGVVWAVTDPRDGKKVALKKLPNIFQSVISSKRVFRELKMLCFFKHENVLSALEILQPPLLDFFQELYVITELLQSDLHKIIVSPQQLSSDHIKVFLYQILRGLKYVHSAKILHRDIKPARAEENDPRAVMTQEVVTQYYRAPEILMGAKHYTNAIDMWSVGCIFAELLKRRILFQAQSPVHQLEMITDLLGTPTLSDMKYACEPAKSHMLKRVPKPSQINTLYNLGAHATHEAVHLLCQMLVYDPDRRMKVEEALNHPYLDEGRLRYHSCMCSCCFTTSAGVRQFTEHFEPISPLIFDSTWEKRLTTVQQIKEEMHSFICKQSDNSHVPLCINPQSAAFKSFAR